MKKNFFFFLIAIIFLFAGCNNALTTSGNSNIQGNSQYKNVVHCSEAQICKDQLSSPNEVIDSILKKFGEALDSQNLTDIMKKGGNDEGLQRIILPETEIAMFYRTSKPKTTKEVPIIAAQFGLGINVTPFHGIFWYQDGKWKSQAYPRANDQVSKKREKIFEKSPFGTGQFMELHQEDEYLAIVVNMGGGGTHYAQEVHLLKRINDKWEIIWVPTYDNWEVLWDSIVKFDNGIQEFTVYRKDIKDPNNTWEEKWKLQDDEYVLLSTNK